jgi:hypothetical protein
MDEWKRNPDSQLYDAELIRQRLNELHRLETEGDMLGIVYWSPPSPAQMTIWLKFAAAIMCCGAPRPGADPRTLILGSRLRSGIVRNLGGTGHAELYNHSLVGTKRLIEAHDEAMVQFPHCEQKCEILIIRFASPEMGRPVAPRQ